MLKKWAVLVLSAMVLCGCGYKGALYIPQAPEQTSPSDKLGEKASSPEAQIQPASTPGEFH